jgi:hypothetical protein
LGKFFGRAGWDGAFELRRKAKRAGFGAVRILAERGLAGIGDLAEFAILQIAWRTHSPSKSAIWSWDWGDLEEIWPKTGRKTGLCLPLG